MEAIPVGISPPACRQPEAVSSPESRIHPRCRAWCHSGIARSSSRFTLGQERSATSRVAMSRLMSTQLIARSQPPSWGRDISSRRASAFCLARLGRSSNMVALHDRDGCAADAACSIAVAQWETARCLPLSLLRPVTSTTRTGVVSSRHQWWSSQRLRSSWSWCCPLPTWWARTRRCPAQPTRSSPSHLHPR